MNQRCAGFTVLEALVALLLGCLLATLSVGTFARQRTLQATFARRGEALATLRVTRHLLGREWRAGDGIEEVGEDTLTLRAYRGVGVVCATGADPRELLVRVEGVRAPEPAKDSVRVSGAGGEVRILALLDRRAEATGCPVGSARASGPGSVPGLERWSLSDEPPAAPLLARYFERGSYHLAGGALRYRRGAAGRQPLTPQVVLTPPSRFVPDGHGSARVELFLAEYGTDPPPLVPSLVLVLRRPAGVPGG